MNGNILFIVGFIMLVIGIVGYIIGTSNFIDFLEHICPILVVISLVVLWMGGSFNKIENC